jgi:ABC-type transporter Mla MlaB component
MENEPEISEMATEVASEINESPVFTVDNITVSFPTTVGISDVMVLKKVLDSQLLGCAVSIDTAAVEVIDTAILQTLLVFCKEADEKGVFTDWESPSAAVLDAIQLLGLSDMYGFPKAA